MQQRARGRPRFRPDIARAGRIGDLSGKRRPTKTNLRARRGLDDERPVGVLDESDPRGDGVPGLDALYELRRDGDTVRTRVRLF